MPGRGGTFLRDAIRDPDRRLAVPLWIVIAVALVVLSRGLPPRSFFVGDPGVKLIAARNAIAHPGRPLDIDLPAIGGRQVDLMDPFFRVHGDHAHAITSESFVLASSALIAAFGIRGAFILPAAGFLLALAAVASIGRSLDSRRSRTWTIVVAAACTPLMFYALEFWEHTVAVGTAALATALLVRPRRDRRTLVLSGALLGISALLRPEAAWFAAALLAASPFLPSPLTSREIAVTIAGAAIGYAPLVLWSIVHSGHLLGAHVGGNLPSIGDRWSASRLAILRSWLMPEHSPLALAAVASIFIAVAAGARRSGEFALRLAGIAIAIFVSIAAVRRMFPPATIWCAAPVATIVMALGSPRERAGRAFLLTVTVVFAVCAIATAPTDGGGQWGPRYLLLAFIPIAVLAADGIETPFTGPFVARLAVTAILIGASLLIQRNAYKELQSTKRTYGRIVDAIERSTPADAVLVTDVWWVDQVAAALYPGRTFLFAATPAAAHDALASLAAAHTGDVFVIRSRSESTAAPLAEWLAGTGLASVEVVAIPERELEIHKTVRLSYSPSSRVSASPK